jgi:hypothetical protein
VYNAANTDKKRIERIILVPGSDSLGTSPEGPDD